MSGELSTRVAFKPRTIFLFLFCGFKFPAIYLAPLCGIVMAGVSTGDLFGFSLCLCLSLYLCLSVFFFHG